MPLPGTNEQHPAWHCRKYLPHREQVAMQTVTFRLHDSVPRNVIAAWKEATEEARDNGEKKLQREVLNRIAQYEDSGYGQCFLQDRRVAEMVQDTLLHFDGVKYSLVRWCIMPNHVHLLIEVVPGTTLSSIMHSIRSYTAHQANKLLNRTGKFWMEEYFDRFIRTDKHFRYAWDYIDYNPVKAGLTVSPQEWPWSAAYVRDGSGRA